MIEAREAVAGKTGWIISDGKTGNDVQTRGVFDALGFNYEVKSVDPRGIWKLLSPWGPVNPAERFGTTDSQFRPPWPEFAISIGRLTTPYIRRLKRAARLATYTIILQNPKVGPSAADLFWVPEHDTRRGPNVITTLTAPHSFTARRLQQLNHFALEAWSIFAGWLGGDERVPPWGKLRTQAPHFVELAHPLHDEHGGPYRDATECGLPARHERKDPFAFSDQTVKRFLALEPSINGIVDLPLPHPHFADA